MNRNHTSALLGICALLNASTASASGLLGQWVDEPTTSEPTRIGYDVSSAEFPDFQNFTFQQGGTRNAGFGMVYRTHRHLRARRSKTPSAYKGLLSTKALGHANYDVLTGVIADDTKGHSVRFRHFSNGRAFARNVIRRLRAQEGSWNPLNAFSEENLRDLVFAVESESGLRRRYLFVYLAEQAEDGSWHCKAYDPHVKEDQEERFPELRVSKMGVVQIEASWDREAGTQGGDAFGGDIEDGWTRLDPSRIGVASTGHLWNGSVTGYEVDATPSGFFALGDRVAATKGTINHVAIAAQKAMGNKKPMGIDHGAHDSVAETGMPRAD